MAKQRWIKDRFGDSRRAPMTIHDAIVLILEHMQSSVALIARTDYRSVHNPQGLPEMSMASTKVYGTRYWQAAERLIKEGAVVAANGSPDCRDDFRNPLYMVAGPNYAKAVKTYLGDVGVQENS
ncbi:hypothetical protein CcrC1_gp388 [Caulobacter phage C1]|nr:hypothetical protein CcrC1_gp388 [Caulobacter phage C1]UTU08617.1 hypothetical protein CcrC2_gp389 [Caulobacter phage C2]UTU09132.1 hypothetical protein CcrJ4_gp383 [Caulobacter phage J4]UTU10250.1 hypothetical protein CcrRB23_gp388 [Caulobacter phage RB23]WGN97284.1 hypothetical protein [Bertelyvirus sp.]